MRLIKPLAFAVVMTVAAGLMFGVSSRVEAEWPTDCLPSATVQFVECFNVGSDTDLADDITPAGDANTVVTDENPGWTDPDGAGADCAIRAEELRVNGATTPQPCVTPAFSGFANYTITFDWGRDVAGTTSMTVEYSTDGGSTFQTLEVFTSQGDENTCGDEGANCATSTHSETLALGCANDEFVLRFVGTTIENDDYYVDNLLVAGVGEPCFDPNVTVTKVFEGGDPTSIFTFTYTGPGCSISIDGGAVAALVNDGTFELTGGQTAALVCEVGINTFVETDPSPDATFGSAECTPEGTPVQFGVSVAVPVDPTGPIACTFTNTAGEADTLDIVVKKECVGVEGTFTINVGGAATDLSQDVACGDFVTFADLEPGSYTVEEVLDEASGGGGGSDSCTTACNLCADPCAEAEGGIVTTIACSDLQQVEGTSVTVELVDVDIFCVFINSEEDLGNLLCGCLNLDLEIDNDNTNTIGIDNDNTNTNDNANNNENENENKNENKNDNVNTNTQNQENAQDQDNTNEQTNNITSSPEVNIDFD